MATYDIDGIMVTPLRSPSLDDITTLRLQAKGEPPTHDMFKAMCKRLLAPDVYRELCEAAPNCFEGLGVWLLEEAAVGGDVVLLEEHEVEDPEMVKALVSLQETAAKQFAGKSERMARLFPIVAKFRGESRLYILRMPRAGEVDEVKKQKTGTACKAFLRSICRWGNTDALEADAPGVIFTLTEFALSQAGGWSARRVEK
jgi:hypothetical protein